MSRPCNLDQRKAFWRNLGPQIAPSILSADFARLEEHLRPLLDAGCPLLHLDVMDGHFVPNLSFGIPIIQAIRRRTNAFFDAHFMIEEPARYAKAFAEAGCDHITFHIEVARAPEAVIRQIHDLGLTCGLALNPATPFEAVESVIDQVELVLVMSVWPGFGGQSFIADVLPKAERCASKLQKHQRLQIDGGIDLETLPLAAKAGVTVFVAGSAIFGKGDSPRPDLNYRAIQSKL